MICLPARLKNKQKYQRKEQSSMSILKKMKEMSARTRTMNGAVTYETSQNACLDLFAVGGGMRYRKDAELLRLFDRAYIENPDLSMKLLFYIRDIRGGMGERKSFRRILRHVACVWPASAQKNVRYISEYGRWDDLLSLMGTRAQEEVVRVIREQMEKDLEAVRRMEEGQKDVSISLLAKWLPSDNASSAASRGKARILASELGLSKREYRNMLVRIRRHLSLAEVRLTQRQPGKIRYEALPAGAMMKYRCAFQRSDSERFMAYLEDVRMGKAQMHADTLDPPQILQPMFSGRIYRRSVPRGVETLEALWKSLSVKPGSRNALCVVDTSGSMYWSANGAPVPAHLALSLGLYFAERCAGAFRNHIVTFESRPHLIELKGESLMDRLRYLQAAPWGGSTDLSAVFDLVLNAALEMKVPQGELPSVLYIISDMEFNVAFRRPGDTVYEDARKEYEAHGYELPAVVFHNVNAWQTQTPVRAHTKGAALVSGSGVAAMSSGYTKNTTPMSHMLEVLGSKRYQCIHA